MLDDVINEIKGAKSMQPEAGIVETVKPTRKKREKKPMTEEEIQAYRERKMREEEERYLGKQPKPRKRKAKNESATKQKKAKAHKKERKQRRPRKTPVVKLNKGSQPFETICFLKVPGMPKGDQLAICLIHGAET